MNLLELRNVSRRHDGRTKDVLSRVNIGFESGKLYTIIGKGGSGKTTLLSLMAGLDACDGGEIRYNGRDLREIDCDRYRARDVGAVFQDGNLLTNATAMENILLSMDISQSDCGDRKAYAGRLLQRVGIEGETAGKRVAKLSCGERQRVSIARILSHDPAVIFADEPTDGLDADTEADILSILESLAHEEGKCVIVATGSKRVASVSDEIWALSDGNLLLIRCVQDELA